LTSESEQSTVRPGAQSSPEIQRNLRKLGYDELIRLCLERGFFFPSAEIYNDSPAGFWEYGPLGLLMRENIVREWRRSIVRRDDMLEIDGSVILPKIVFEASGHLGNLVDPIVECTKCKTKIRADKYIAEKTGLEIDERLQSEELEALIQKYGLRCPKCGGELGKPSKFNMMFRVSIGAEGSEAYLRPETAQSIFVDFARLSKTMRIKLPIGIAQVGRSFRNEIAPRQTLVRLRELVQAEVEVFFDPQAEPPIDPSKFDSVSTVVMNFSPQGVSKEKKQKDVQGEREVVQLDTIKSVELTGTKIFSYYLALLQQFYESIGFPKEKTRFRELSPSDRAFYTTKAYDFEVMCSLGWLELVACNYRTDYDLSNHAKMSGKDLSIMDEKTKRKLIPHVIELSIGIDRTLFSLLDIALYRDEDREILRLDPKVAPYLSAVFPLISKPEFESLASKIFLDLKQEMGFATFYDDSGAIGRRYRRMDQVGTPYCITVDAQTLHDGTVTLRERDSMKQGRVPAGDIRRLLRSLKEA
jgi:glycyl-tRNA synthetase